MKKRSRSKPSRATPVPARRSAAQANWKFWLQVAAILATCAAIYWPALNGSFLWDDKTYTTDNLLLNDPSRLWKIWFQPDALTEYYPATMTVEYVLWVMFGQYTLPYHLVSTLMHAGSALLIWRLLARLGVRWSWFGGLLFAAHPLAVESVAWISELKNTLSLPAFLLALICYIDYDASRRPGAYWSSLGWFAVSMLFKISTAPLPAVVVLYLWWKHGRVVWSDLKALAPFFAAALVWGAIVSVGAEHHVLANPEPPTSDIVATTPARVAVVGLVIAFYLARFFLPLGLEPLYPRWDVVHIAWFDFLPWPVLGAIACWCWMHRTTWGRHALFGLGYFFVTLLPVLGFVYTRCASMVWSLEHMVYLPMIGLIGLAAAGLGWMAQSDRTVAKATIGICTLAVVLLACESNGYAAWYTSGLTLWTNAIESDPENASPRSLLGTLYAQQNQMPDAIKWLGEAATIRPEDAEIHDNLGVALGSSSQPQQAIEQFRAAIRIFPDFVQAHINLGTTLLNLGRVQEARAEFEKAVKLSNGNPVAMDELGLVEMRQGNLPAAIDDIRVAVRKMPKFSDGHNNLGNALFQAGRRDEALQEFAEAVRLDPGFTQARYNYATTLMASGHLPDAVQQFQTLLQADPHYPHATEMLAKAQTMETEARNQPTR